MDSLPKMWKQNKGEDHRKDEDDQLSVVLSLVQKRNLDQRSQYEGGCE